MISADKAREMINKEKAIEFLKKRIEARIMDAIERGASSTFLDEFDCVCKIKSDGSFSAGFGGAIIDCTNEIREWLYSYGYTIKPTGFIGGVRQLTEDIVW